MLQSIINYFRQSIKKSIDNIRNEKLRHNLLQAIPFWIASFVTGVAAVIYAKIFKWGEDLLAFIIDWNKAAIFIVMPTAFVLSWWLVKRFAPYARGSGIPQVMASVDMANKRENHLIHHFLSLKILLIKVISSVILVIGGGAIGREGPTLQIAGSIFTKIHQLLPSWWPRVSKKNMVMTSAAAGLSAAFNTPLGGIVFTIEQLSKTHFSYFKTALFTAVIIAGLTAQSFAGSYLYLGYPKTQGVTMSIIIPVIVVSAIAGIAASHLSGIMIALSRCKNRLKNDKAHVAYLVFIALVIATVAYFINIEVLGSGADIMNRTLFTDNKHEDWYVPIFRMMGTALSFSSGGAGGIFAPSLAAGASFGSVISEWMKLTANETNVLILAGMVAFLTGITRTPFTSTIIVLEMTDRYSLIMFLMLAGMISSIFALLVSNRSFYDKQKDYFLEEMREKDKEGEVGS